MLQQLNLEIQTSRPKIQQNTCKTFTEFGEQNITISRNISEKVIFAYLRNFSGVGCWRWGRILGIFTCIIYQTTSIRFMIRIFYLWCYRLFFHDFQETTDNKLMQIILSWLNFQLFWLWDDTQMGWILLVDIFKSIIFVCFQH